MSKLQLGLAMQAGGWQRLKIPAGCSGGVFKILNANADFVSVQLALARISAHPPLPAVQVDVGLHRALTPPSPP